MSPADERPYLLPDEARVPAGIRRHAAEDYERFAREGLPAAIEEHLLSDYQLDVRSEYAGWEISNPWGKASGQLSMTAAQVADDVQAGLAFVVLKTVIALDQSGRQSMAAWAVPESRMVARRIVGRSGEAGWTIDWKGRGWWQSFDEYLQLLRSARRAACGSKTLIVPSCKFHLPTREEGHWNQEEYDVTIRRLLEAWNDIPSPSPLAGWMPLEKDFSPTLAGSERAAERERILHWLRTVPQLVHHAAVKARRDASLPGVRVGLKLFNALFDDDFQWEMLRTLHDVPAGSPARADFFVYANRLFDPQREFEGQRGIACGGPDLSDRNLRVLSRFHGEAAAGNVPPPLLPFSATGNITTGKMALEYALRGASSFQMHTLFQLPAGEYRMSTGSKTHKALHELYFHPRTGFVVWMHHLAEALNLPRNPLRFRDVIGQAGRL